MTKAKTPVKKNGSARSPNTPGKKVQMRLTETNGIKQAVTKWNRILLSTHIPAIIPNAAAMKKGILIKISLISYRSKCHLTAKFPRIRKDKKLKLLLIYRRS